MTTNYVRKNITEEQGVRDELTLMVEEFNIGLAEYGRIQWAGNQ